MIQKIPCHSKVSTKARRFITNLSPARIYEFSIQFLSVAVFGQKLSPGFDFVQPQRPDGETWTFCNVLWVEWKDGVAYRKGAGRVKRRTWEVAEKEDVELVLG